MSQVFTSHEKKICENCDTEMQEIQVGIFKCFACGVDDDNY